MKRLYAILICLLLPGLLTAQEKPGTITTFAGTGEEGVSGDGGPATQANLWEPKGVAVDASGSIYITMRGRIRRVRSDGIITKFVGGEGRGGLGDGELATEAGFRIVIGLPAGVVADAKKNAYVTDTGNHRVRRVDANGFIWTFAGPKDVGTFSQPPPPGSFSGDGGPALEARLNQPVDVAVDAQGNVYIADLENSRIRQVDPNGFISTFAGTGRIITGPPGDGGQASQATLISPYSVAVDTKGNVYIADYNAHRIRRVSPTYVITTLAGTGTLGFSGDGGPATQAQLNNPSGVTVDAAGSIYIADRGNQRIRRVGRDGIITTFAGTGVSGYSGDGGPATQAVLNNPSDVAVDAKGFVYIADTGNNRVRRVSPLESLPEPPLISFSVPSLVFDANVGATAEHTFTISNTGKAPLEVSRVGVEGTTEFRVSPTSATVAPGGSQTVIVTFSPASSGQKTASLTIVHNAVGSPSTISLSGRGIPVLSSFRSPDFDGDGKVGFDDFFLFASVFGKKRGDVGFEAKYDLNEDGEVDFNDFFIFAGDFGR